MRAISLYQPHASLIAVGEKQWETRPHKTHIRSVVAIASTQRTPRKWAAGFLGHPIFKAAFKRHGLFASTLPAGCIVAVCEITECIDTGTWMRRYCRATKPGYSHESEYTFGDYSPGRFAWRLENIRRLTVPVPCSGGQRFWTVPLDVEAKVRANLP